VDTPKISDSEDYLPPKSRAGISLLSGLMLMEGTESSCAFSESAARGTAWGESFKVYRYKFQGCFFQKAVPGIYLSSLFRIFKNSKQSFY
jgi:hypothetical protein